MRLSIKSPFAVTIAVMSTALVWLIKDCYVVVVSLFWSLATGTIFSKYVHEPYQGMAGDSFQCSITKMFLVGTFLSAALLPLIAVLFYITDLTLKVRKRIFMAFSFALCLFPFSALGLAVMALARYIAGMGLASGRVKGLACGLFGLFVIGGFLYWIARARGLHEKEH